MKSVSTLCGKINGRLMLEQVIQAVMTVLQVIDLSLLQAITSLTWLHCMQVLSAWSICFEMYFAVIQVI